MTSQIHGFTGGTVLDEEGLKPILKVFKEELMNKNVGAEV